MRLPLTISVLLLTALTALKAPPAAAMPAAPAAPVGALPTDTVTAIAPVSVSLKRPPDYRRQSTMATSIDMTARGSEGAIVEPKDLSLAIPNMLHADYGSRMTSSIYIRGLGSRMDQPALGLYVDGVPVMGKNNYDFDYHDLSRIDVLRGPQGTLYGRNTIGGVVEVQTLSPFDWQGVRLGAGYGNANTWHARAAIYRRESDRFAWSVSASHRSTDGFFTNTFDGSRADAGRSSSVRIKLQGRLSNRWTVDNSLQAGLVSQSGFAYAPYDEQTGAAGATGATNRAGDINHNDPCTYDRFNLTEGLTFRYTGTALRLSSTTGYQFSDDDMALDNDFSPRSLFSLRQTQREHTLTQEFTLRSSGTRRWQWIGGLFAFHRRVDISAPVLFKRDGIDELILANANEGIHTAFPEADLLIREEEFPIASNFRQPSSGVSFYHQSTWRTGRWTLTAGLRADWEHTAITYRNRAEINYRFTLTMPDYRPLAVEMEGSRSRSFLEVMPRASAMYDLGTVGNVYASVSRGYKAGGYNTQIFSDIVQNRMMNDMMADLGIYFGDGQNYDIEKAISYEPERSWNWEVGGHFSGFDGRLSVDAALFWIDCRNQQLTVFPPGRGTGRLMSNAGRTRSVGAEVTVTYSTGGLLLTGSYGHTDARFTEYNDGREDYSGGRVPYAPANTLSARAQYTFALRGGRAGELTPGVGVQGVGRIVWSEANTISQPFYSLVSASVDWRRGDVGVSLWARNITGADYNTFYFRSVGRSFVQRGKPLQAGIAISLTL